MNIYIKYLILIASGVLLFGCRQDYYDEDISIPNDDQIKFIANLTDIAVSRALPQEGAITQDTLNLTFLNTKGNYEVGKVIFKNSIGYSYRVGEDDNLQQLVWDDVYPSDFSQQTYDFYLDNLIPSDSVEYVPLPEDNPYHFGKFNHVAKDDEDNELPSADLVQGALKGVQKSHSPIVNLSHRMSVFTLRIKSNNQGFENQRPIKAWISNVRSAATSFVRASGYIGVGTSTDITKEKPIMLVENNEKIYEDWTQPEVETQGVQIYDSPEFIIPPQYFYTNNWPRLTVELEDGKTYSGLIPRYMSLEDDTGSYYPRLTEFLSGYKLALTVTLTTEANHLIFMPAYFYTWYGKGIQNVTGNQASLNDEMSFDELFEKYQEASEDSSKNKDDQYGFSRWGFYDEINEQWFFNIFQNQSLEENDIKGKMPEDPDIKYSFLLHYAIVTILMNDGEEINLTSSNGGEEKLKDFVNKGTIDTGIYSGADLKLLADAYSEKPEGNFKQWGFFDEEKWIFNLYQDIEIKASDLSSAMIENEKYKYIFYLAGHKITLTLNNNKKITLTETEGAQILKELMNEGKEPES